MSQSAPLSLQAPPPNMKKKIIIALMVVAVGHMGVLWGVSQIKTPELKPVEKKPIKVKLVKIKEELPPPPPPKEKVKPKEVKIVKKAEAPPAKEIKKIQTTKADTPKPVLQPVTKPPAPVPVISSSSGNKPTPKPEPAPEPTPAPPVVTPAPVVTTKNVNVGGSGVQWQNSPNFKFTAAELKSAGCTVSVLIRANEKGKVTGAEAKSTSCNPNLTQKVLRAVSAAKFKPYTENGVAYPIVAQQPFDLK